MSWADGAAGRAAAVSCKLFASVQTDRAVAGDAMATSPLSSPGKGVGADRSSDTAGVQTLSGAARPHSQGSVLVGLIGAGIQASRTPTLHEREGAEQGLRYIYKLIDLEVLGLDARSLPEIL